METIQESELDNIKKLLSSKVLDNKVLGLQILASYAMLEKNRHFVKSIMLDFYLENGISICNLSDNVTFFARYHNNYKNGWLFLKIGTIFFVKNFGFSLKEVTERFFYEHFEKAEIEAFQVRLGAIKRIEKFWEFSNNKA